MIKSINKFTTYLKGGKLYQNNEVVSKINVNGEIQNKIQMEHMGHNKSYGSSFLLLQLPKGVRSVVNRIPKKRKT